MSLLVECRQLTKSYPSSQTALSNLNLQINSGEMVFLTGHSGAGKTTLLKLIACLERPTRGDLIVGNNNITTMLARNMPALRRRLGIVLQNPQFLENRTVYDNIALPLFIRGCHRHEITRRVRGALDKVGLLGKETAYPNTLSCGEQQRIGIARAIVNKPALLLADEPTGNLDPDLSVEILQLFGQFNQMGVTVLIATHDLGLIASLPHRILYLQGGRLV